MTTFTIPRMQDSPGAADDIGEGHGKLLDKIDLLLRAISSADETRVLMAGGCLRVAAGFASNTGPLAFLQRWLEGHLANEDKKFADFSAQQAPPVAAAAAQPVFLR
jgi:hypothetical protein